MKKFTAIVVFYKSNYPFLMHSAIYDPALLVPAVPPISFVTTPSLMLFSIAETTAAA